MSNRRQPADRPRPHRPQVTKVKDPADVIAVVPYLLGFDPKESLVVVALEGPRQRFGPCARLDLLVDDALPDAVASQVDYVGELVAHHGFDPVLLIAYSTRAVVADAVMGGIIERLRLDGVHVVEAVRADGARWWSYTCTDPGCCPPNGTPYDAGSSRVAAEAVVAGLSRAPNRDALREQFDPQPLRLAAFEESLHALVAGPADFIPLTTDAFRSAVLRAVSSGEPPAMDDLVRFVLTVQIIALRDEAWLLMRREDAADHFAFWCDVLRATPDDLLAPVGSLAAFAAWLSGRGVLASHAAERVLSVDPDYSMARLVLTACESSMNPAHWVMGAGSLSRDEAS